MRTIELVGVAGSGKTTLFRALAALDPELRDSVPDARVDHARLGLCHSAVLLPAWLRRRGRWLSESEMRAMNYVAAWAERIERRGADDPIVLFDHGPLFRMARLRATGPPLIESAAFRRWSASAVRRWAKLLDAVVFLDAPDALLVERIDSREQPHRMKCGDSDATLRFLTRYRAVYEALFSELAAAGGPNPLRIDTSREPADALAARLLGELLPARDRRA